MGFHCRLGGTAVLCFSTLCIPNGQLHVSQHIYANSAPIHGDLVFAFTYLSAITVHVVKEIQMFFSEC